MEERSFPSHSTFKTLQNMPYPAGDYSDSEQWFPAMNPEDFCKPDEPVEQEPWSEMYGGEVFEELADLLDFWREEEEKQQVGNVVEVQLEHLEHVEPEKSNFVELPVAQIVEDHFEQVPIDFGAHGAHEAHGAHQSHILIPNGQFSDLEHHHYPVVYQEQIEPHQPQYHQQNTQESESVCQVPQEQQVVIEQYAIDTGAQELAQVDTIQQNIVFLETPAPQYQQMSELRMLLERPVQPIELIEPTPRGTKRSLAPPTISWKRHSLHKWPKVHNPNGASQDRPTITYTTLATLALLNSPNLTATFYTIFTFILHHFPFYRSSPNWESSIRRAVTGNYRYSKVFECVQKNKVGSLYTLKDVESARERAKCEVKGSTRDYSRMLNGELGLPRPLFYQIVGFQEQRFAGPENSAMFYHLLQMKCLPAPAHFKEYTEHVERFEPRWEEKERNYGFEFREGGIEQEDVEQFHQNIDEYFKENEEVARGAQEDNSEV